MDDTLEQLLQVSDVAPILRLKRAAIYKAAAEGRIPCVVLWQGTRRRVIRFRRRDIATWIASRSIR